MESFSMFNIPESNIIGFGSDGCNVMLGASNSVSSRLNDKYPGIFVLKCVCHSAHLCASEVCKQLPRHCEDFARNIFNYLKSSSKRLAEFVQFQSFLEIDPLKILHPSQTRWLNQRLLCTEQIFKSLHDPFIKLYFYFLEWILPKFTRFVFNHSYLILNYLVNLIMHCKIFRFNQYFQTQSVVIKNLHNMVIVLYQEILLCFLKREYIMQTKLSDINPRNGEF